MKDFQEKVLEWCKQGMTLESGVRKVYEDLYVNTEDSVHLKVCRKQSLRRMLKIVNVVNSIENMTDDFSKIDTYRAVLKLMPTYHPICVYAREELIKYRKR